MNVFVLNTKEDILKNVRNRAVLRHHCLPQYCFPTMEVNGSPKQPDHKLTLKYLPLCSEQIHSYRFGTTWGWVNDFWVNYSFNNLCLLFGDLIKQIYWCFFLPRCSKNLSEEGNIYYVKWIVHPKINIFYLRLLILKLFQTSMSILLLLNTK